MRSATAANSRINTRVAGAEKRVVEKILHEMAWLEQAITQTTPSQDDEQRECLGQGDLADRHRYDRIVGHGLGEEHGRIRGRDERRGREDGRRCIGLTTRGSSWWVVRSDIRDLSHHHRLCGTERCKTRVGTVRRVLYCSCSFLLVQYMYSVVILENLGISQKNTLHTCTRV